MELISLIKSVYVYTHSFSLLLLSSGQFWSSVSPPWYMHKRQNSLKAGSVKWLHSLSSNRYCSDSPCKPFSEMSACCLTARALQSFVWSKTGATTSMERDHTERNSPWWALGKAKLRQRFPKGRIDSLYGLGSRDPCHDFLTCMPANMRKTSLSSLLLPPYLWGQAPIDWSTLLMAVSTEISATSNAYLLCLRFSNNCLNNGVVQNKCHHIIPHVTSKILNTCLPSKLLHRITELLRLDILSSWKDHTVWLFYFMKKLIQRNKPK